MLQFLLREPGRILHIAGAAAVFALALWALSTFIVSLDRIESAALAWLYAGLVLAPAAAGTFFLFRRTRAQAPAGLRRAAPPRPKATDRIARLSRMLELPDPEPVLRVSASAAAEGAALSASRTSRKIQLAVVGVAGVGKSSLVRALASPRPGERPALTVALAEAASFDTADAANARAAIARADGVLLVLDQDIRSYEHAVIEPALATDKPVLVALNKADRLAGRAREEVLGALRERLGAVLGTDMIFATAAQPGPRLQVVVHPDGREEQREVAATPDVAQALAALDRLAATGGYRSVAVEPAS